MFLNEGSFRKPTVFAEDAKTEQDKSSDIEQKPPFGDRKKKQNTASE